MILKREDVKWLTRHDLDALGETFTYQGRLFRVIHDEKREYVMELFKSGIMQEMIERHFFVDTWICDDVQLENEEKKLILEHKHIRHMSFAHEWSYGMFVAARKMVAEFSIFLLEHGYEIIDVHYANVAFDGCFPVYLDLGSIFPANISGMEAWRTFRDYWVVPCKLLENNKVSFQVFRSLVFSYTSFTPGEYNKLTKSFGGCRKKVADIRDMIAYRLYDNSIQSPRKLVNTITKLCHKVLGITEKKIERKKIRNYKNYTTCLDKYIKRNESKGWTEYSDEYIENGHVIVDERFAYYMNMICDLKQKDRIDTTFEIAGNSGCFSQLLLEKNLVQYAGVSDYDAGAIEKGFARCSINSKINGKISFTILDIASQLENASAYKNERYQSDIVIALAITHHLILTQKIKLSTIVDILNQYSKKYVIVEFMPLGLWAGNDETCPAVPEWYTLDWFVGEVEKKFEILKVEQISKNRVCVLAKKM